jgi:CRP-like cAMP-binding protein
MPSGGHDELHAEPVIRRLDAFRKLSDKAAALIKSALRERILKAAAGEDLVCEGDPCNTVRIFLSGWACRYKVLEDGRRQIVGFILPGDTCDAHIYLFSRMDHSIGTLTPVSWCEFDRAGFEQLISADKTIAEALYCETLVNGAIQREWALNIGRRDALERVAHIICELFARLSMVGLADASSFAFPVTQMELADTIGLSTVHVNRTLQELRAAGLITLKGRQMIIHDLDALSRTAMFTPDYLHLDRR